jgi:hypothetical protein
MKKGIILLALLMTGIHCGFSQANNVSQAQTLFIYNFSRMIQWPAGNQSGDFIIGVVGNNELYHELATFVANKKVGTQSIVVKKFDDPQSISRCHIVFVGNGKVTRFGEIVSRLQGTNCLIITERKGMVNSGSAIDFFIVEDKLKYAFNQDNAEKYNLTVSKSLKDMSYNN